MYIYIYTYIDSVYLSIYLSIFIVIRVHTYVHPSIHPSIHPSTHPSIHPSIHACMHACILRVSHQLIGVPTASALPVSTATAVLYRSHVPPALPLSSPPPMCSPAPSPFIFVLVPSCSSSSPRRPEHQARISKPKSLVPRLLPNYTTTKSWGNRQSFNGLKPHAPFQNFLRPTNPFQGQTPGTTTCLGPPHSVISP